MVKRLPGLLVVGILIILFLHTHDAGCLPQVCYR